MSANKDLFESISMHLLQDEWPSSYINEISDEPFFRQFPFGMLAGLKETGQSPKHHPEGNVWNHTMLVVDEAARVKERSIHRKAFMWAALLHDIGKPDTTRTLKGRITSYNHDKVGAQLAGKFLEALTDDRDLIDRVKTLVRWHMQILFVVNDLPFAEIKAMSSEADINEIALLGLCDRMGRLGADLKAEEENISRFLQKCSSSAECQPAAIRFKRQMASVKND